MEQKSNRFLLLFSRKMRFEKWHGTGNDFLFFDNRNGDVSFSTQEIQKKCHRRFGLGADALILFESSLVADAKMNYFNADGTSVESCGNGLRCTAAFGFRHGFLTGEWCHIENPNGRIDEVVRLQNGNYRVNFGAPACTGLLDFPDSFLGKPLFLADGLAPKIWCVSMGNPHAVQFVSDISSAPVKEMGPIIEHHPLFPNRINAEFVRVISPNEADFRVWERGCGETFSCGTGAAAAVVAGVLAGYFAKNTEILLHLRGGDLRIFWDQKKNMVLKTGPTQFVFWGEEGESKN